jgi:hypothetical protein
VVQTRLQSYEKSRAEQNKLVCFLCRDRVTSLISQQSYRKTREKPDIFELFQVHSKFGEAKDTKSREQNKQ